jgi:DNA uptake protein ComE-like DNA-binding protein
MVGDSHRPAGRNAVEATRSAILALALVLIAAACGGDDPEAMVDADAASDEHAGAAGGDASEEPDAVDSILPASGDGAQDGDEDRDTGHERQADAPEASPGAVEPSDPDAGCAGGRIDVNNAGTHELERIVHIGPARAEQVEELRPFTNLRDLTRVPGIGEKRLTEIVEQNVACVG